MRRDDDGEETPTTMSDGEDADADDDDARAWRRCATTTTRCDDTGCEWRQDARAIHVRVKPWVRLSTGKMSTWEGRGMGARAREEISFRFFISSSIRPVRRSGVYSTTDEMVD
jgi:hypothetical protein